MSDPVILLHGLWMRRPALWWLAARLREQGFTPHLFAYATLWGAPERSLQRLGELARRLGPGPVHWLGHSLGGVTALAALAANENLPPGRIVCLGSPLAGSQAAWRMGEIGLAALVGRARPLLLAGVSVPPGREVGMIAGSHGVGGGRWITRFDGPHDGTVALAETRIAGLADHLTLPVSHSGMLFSREAAAAAGHFLKHGRFTGSPSAPSYNDRLTAIP